MKYKNYLFWGSLIIILFYSILNIYNAKLLDYSFKYYYLKQLLWIFIGIIIFFLLKKINNEKVFNIGFILYIISLVLLGLVLIIGKEINGAKAWINLKFFSFQPSELMRLSLSLFLISLTNNFNFRKFSDIFFILITGIITLIPSILVFLEPDTGAIIFFFLIYFGILWNSPIKRKWIILFIFVILFLLSMFFYLYFFQQDILINLIGTSFFYRMDRLLNFYNNVGYQMENALTTICNATFLGTGIDKILLYIPEGHSDFILAFSFGNFGLLSGIIILFCYYLLDILLIKKSKRVKDKKSKMLFNIFLLLFIFQQLYNILMNVNLLPIMGIPLPFLSYGGSTIIIYFTYLGLLLKNN